MPPLDLHDAWADLLRRRAALSESLALYGDVLALWRRTLPPVSPLGREAEGCRACWSRGIPLVADAPLDLTPESVEELLSSILGLVLQRRPDAADAIDRFAAAWDAGTIGPAALLPRQGRIGAIDEAVGLDAALGAFLAVGTLRPALEACLAGVRGHLRDEDWGLGVCPFCGAPPGFGDVVEDGHRRLACHLCGGAWGFGRLRCPFCGNQETRTLGRLDAEGGDEGYFISTCRECGAYLKELDRRVRWNGGPALLEDWGSPHFDLVAERAGFWRPLAPVILGRLAASP